MASSASCTVAFLMLVSLLCAPYAVEAISCSQVSSFVAPCIGYLRGGRALLPVCCDSVQGLNRAAKSTPDRQTACTCLKIASGTIHGINLDLVGSLPGKCGVSIPYKISPSTDCSKVK